MTDTDSLVHFLRNIPIRELVSALERDDFVLKRTTRTGGHIYTHPDKRIVVIHYHHGSDTLKAENLEEYFRRNPLDRGGSQKTETHQIIINKDIKSGSQDTN